VASAPSAGAWKAKQTVTTDRCYPQIKICGLTRPDQAKACAELGADAIGLVFYEKSPRHLSLAQAAAITTVLPPQVKSVGVFVNPTREALIRTVTACRLGAVQLHGAESPDFVADLARILGLPIIKALFTAKAPELTEADRYDAAGFLVECGLGRLPGGNAMAWNWSLAEAFARRKPLILAGGLAPDNVTQAISACLPDGVDASSGLEAAPGIKDLDKVARFISQVRQSEALYRTQNRKIRQVL
jgi:phosphoribosylanthranilate isomerase